MKAVANGVVLRILVDGDASDPRKDMDGWLGTMVCSHRRYTLGDEQAQNLDEYRGWADWALGEIGSTDDYVMLPLNIYDHSGITMNTNGFSCSWDSGQVGWIYATKQKFRQETGYTEKALFGNDPNAPLEVGDFVTVEGVDDKPHFGKVKSIDGDNVLVDWTYLYTKSRHSDPNLKGTFPRENVKLVTEYAKQMLRNEVEVYDQYLTGDVYGYTIETEDGVHIDSCRGFYGSDWKVNGMLDNVSSEYHYLFDLLSKEGN